ncbi:MAG TPA: hypothetical protein VIL07_12725 [Symbiobacteriaceae bacterium]
MDAVLGLVRHAGNDALFRAVEMSLVATAAGLPLHLHAEGLRGTGKTSVMRAVRRILPRIRRIKGCLYNCDPDRPHCPHHRGLTPEEVARLGEELVPLPFLEISHSAKVGTVVGSIDLSRLVSTDRPEAALLPGTLPQAHRGIIFVDEINRLAETAPELADVLLDVMGTKPGRIQIEETGLPAVELPVQVTVWAASNPDEDPGPLEEIRRQLSDRFDFVVYADRPGDAAVVEQILAAAEAIPGLRPLPGGPEEVERFREELSMRAQLVSRVRVPDALRQQIADLYSRFQVESLRAVQAIHAGIRIAAALEHREEAGPEDLARVAPLALRHRVSPETLRRVVAHLAGLASAGTPPAAASLGRLRQPSVSFGGAALQTAPPQQSLQGAARPGEEMDAAKLVEGAGRRDGAGGDAGATGDFRRADDAAAPGSSGTAEPAAKDAGGTWAERGTEDTQPGRQMGWLARALARLRRQGQKGAPVAQGAGGRPGSPTRTGGPPGPSPTLADPLKHPVVAPPHPARSIGDLAPHELVRTEEELQQP